MSVDRSEVDFDHMCPEFAADPVGTFRVLRAQCPLSYTPNHGGFWAASGYDEIAAIGKDADSFTTARDGGREDPVARSVIPGVEGFPFNIPMELEPPEFFTYRRMLNPLMSPGAVDSFRPMIDAMADYCIDRVIESGKCDLVLDIASPVPALVTLRWLGMPTDDWQQFAIGQHAIVSCVPGTPEWTAGFEGWLYSQNLIADTIAARKNEPQDDIISHLLAQEIDGQPISDADVTSMVGQLITGGVDTTTSLIGQALVYLSEQPDERERILADPKHLDNATEEFLRVFSPVMHIGRTAKTDVEVAGQQVRAGDRVMLAFWAGNHDPAMFPDPEDVKTDRSPNRHMAFGLGMHRCLGSNFARTVFKATATRVLRRMPGFKVDKSAAVFNPAIGITTGWASVPATFTPGPMVGDGQLPERVTTN